MQANNLRPTCRGFADFIRSARKIFFSIGRAPHLDYTNCEFAGHRVSSYHEMGSTTLASLHVTLIRNFCDRRCVKIERRMEDTAMHMQTANQKSAYLGIK